jgi:hypothetical protein
MKPKNYSCEEGSLEKEIKLKDNQQKSDNDIRKFQNSQNKTEHKNIQS